MCDHSFTTSFSVDRTPREAFDASTNVRGWWSEEIDGGTAELGDVLLAGTDWSSPTGASART